MAKTAESARQGHLSAEHIYDSSDEDKVLDSDKSANPASKSEIPNGLPSSPQSSIGDASSASELIPASILQDDVNKVIEDSENEDKGELEIEDEDEVEVEGKGRGHDEDTGEVNKSTSNPDDNNDIESADAEEISQASPAQGQKRRSPDTPEVQESTSVKKAKTVTSNVTIPFKAYKPPKGYEPITPSASDFASDKTPFDSSSDKQFWHLIVPANIPIDIVTNIDLELAMQGQPVLNHNGVKYGMQRLSSTDEMIMVSKGQDGQYKQIEGKVDHSFHVRAVSVNAAVGVGIPERFTAVQAGKVKEIRKQPEGLKMRYTPYGAPAVHAATVDGDVEMRDTLQVPSDVEDVSKAASSAKKKKVKRTNDNRIDEVSPEKKVRGEVPAAPAKSKKARHPDGKKAREKTSKEDNGD